jgi:hypothetical protein
VSARAAAAAAPPLALLCAALIACPSAALAGAAPRAARTTAYADTFALVAPDGVMLTAGVLRHWDVEDGDSPLLRGRYFEAGGSAGANPAYAQGAIFVEWVPLALLQVRLEYDAYGYFGRNGALLRFPSPASRFGEREIAAAAGSEQRALGQRVLLSPTLRAQVGRLVLRSQTDLGWYALATTPGWFYEMEYDTLVARRDLVVSNRSALLVELWRGAGEAMLLAGPGYEVTHASRAAITRQRVEGAVFWSPCDRLGAVQRPRLVTTAGVNLADRNRRHEAFALVGVGADMDL